MGVKLLLIIWHFHVYPVTVIKALISLLIDQLTQEIVPLFNPRRLVWDEHFYLEKARIEGKTQIGQGTARLLQFNVPNRVLSRQVLISQGQYP